MAYVLYGVKLFMLTKTIETDRLGLPSVARSRGSGEAVNVANTQLARVALEF
jgi:hypothetical protein